MPDATDAGSKPPIEEPCAGAPHAPFGGAARSTALTDTYLTQQEPHHYYVQHLASVLDTVFARPFPCGRDANCM
jgi:hypothetical protein